MHPVLNPNADIQLSIDAIKVILKPATPSTKTHGLETSNIQTRREETSVLKNAEWHQRRQGWQEGLKSHYEMKVSKTGKIYNEQTEEKREKRLGIVHSIEGAKYLSRTKDQLLIFQPKLFTPIPKQTSTVKLEQGYQSHHHRTYISKAA